MRSVRAIVAIVFMCAAPVLAQTNLIQVLRDGNPGVDALAGASDGVVSADDRFLYVASRTDDSVSVFEIDPVSGILTPVEAILDGTEDITLLGGALALALSPDGSFLYVGAFDDGGVTVFSRNATTGRLTWVENWIDGQEDADFLGGTRDLVVSPDGGHLYVISAEDDNITTFSRNGGDGTLTFVNNITRVLDDDTDPLFELDFPANIVMDPNGDHLYVSTRGRDAIYLFDRNSGTGELTINTTYLNNENDIEGMDAPDDMALSPDGNNLYVAADFSDSLIQFSRSADGTLSNPVTYTDDGDTLDGLDGITGLLVSDDGNSVYVTARQDGAFSIFSRAGDGALTLSQQIIDDTNNITTFGDVRDVVSALNGRVLYVFARSDNAVNVLSVDDPNLVEIPPPTFVSNEHIILDGNGNLLINLPDPSSDGLATDIDGLGYVVTLRQAGSVLSGPTLIPPDTAADWPIQIQLNAADVPDGTYTVGIRRGPSLSYNSSELGFPSPTAATTLPAAQTGNFSRWLLHIPRQGSGFDAQIQITNRDAAIATDLILLGFDADGVFLAQEAISLDPGQDARFDVYGDAADGLFADFLDGVSHVAVWDPNLQVSVGLSVISQASGLAALFPEANLQDGDAAARSFALPGNAGGAAVTGLAVLNLRGDAAASVSLVQVDDASGDVINEVDLGTIPAGAKRLFVVDSLLTPQLGTSYQLNSTGAGRIQVLGLLVSDTSLLSPISATKRR